MLQQNKFITRIIPKISDAVSAPEEGYFGTLGGLGSSALRRNAFSDRTRKNSSSLFECPSVKIPPKHKNFLTGSERLTPKIDITFFIENERQTLFTLGSTLPLFQKKKKILSEKNHEKLYLGT